MEHKFWIEKWKENQIHFHKQEINPLLIKYLNYIKKDKNRTSLNCLVPLCGKSLDMLWLQENLGTVLGIELSQLALDQFWEENQITPRPKKLNSLNINQGNNSSYQVKTLWFFSIDPDTDHY